MPFRNTTQIYPFLGKPPGTWNLVTAMADDAIDYMTRMHQIQPEKPIFIKYAPGATHAPHHPTKEWVDKIGAMHLFDDGYEKLRERILENQKRLGVIPKDTKLTPWPAEIRKPWDEPSADEKKLFIRQVEVFAAYAAYNDHEIGRVIQAFQNLGKLENTLVIYINGDNGTSAEGGQLGTPNEVAFYWTPGRPLSKTHRVSLLDRQRFHPDGQMRDDEETYNYAPFKQSKMFAKGVTCSDRHDHGFRIPAPTSRCNRRAECVQRLPSRQTRGLGGPADRDLVRDGAARLSDLCMRVSRRLERGSRCQALLAAMAGSGEAPGIVRASALAELPAPDLSLIRRGLSDPDPLVRLGALDGLEGGPANQLWTVASAQLADPVRGVRIRAAELLASVPPSQQPAADRDRFAQAAAEFVAAQRLNADRPDARTALGNFLARQADAASAETEYWAALRLGLAFAPAAINLSDLYRQLGRDGDGERVLRESLSRSPQDASLHHALGLTLVRQKRAEAALDELRQAAVLDPGQARYAYVYAVGLNSIGRRDDAIVVLQEGLRAHPNNLEMLSAAMNFSREKGDNAAALEYAERLARLLPDDSRLGDLIRELKR